jgi:hypothetical protein
MMFVGLDVIGDYVTEINVTSPTGIRELNKKHGVDIGGMLMDAIAGLGARDFRPYPSRPKCCKPGCRPRTIAC